MTSIAPPQTVTVEKGKEFDAMKKALQMQGLVFFVRDGVVFGRVTEADRQRFRAVRSALS